MTAHAHERPDKHRPAEAEAIPLDDVPAFGVQLRFAKRTVKDMLAQLRRRRNGSHKPSH